MPGRTICRSCGHPRLQTISGAVGGSTLWFEFCPACRQVQDRASIPESFLEGMPAQGAPYPLH